MTNYILIGEGYDPHANLAYEELLMHFIKEGEIAMYLWQNQNTVVIGRNQNAWKECKCELLEAEGGKLARRTSGGGAVFHDLGNLNFTFAASPEIYDLERQLSVVLGALTSLGIEAKFSGRNDIVTADGRKFSGNAFRHTRNCSMQHGTLLVAVDMQKLGRYLNPPIEKMRAKGVESVRARVCNLSEFREDLTIEMMQDALTRSFEREYGKAEALKLSRFDTADLAARNASWDWNFAQTPTFDIGLERRFPWGGVELMLELAGGTVRGAKVYSDAMDAELPGRIEQALTGVTYGAQLADAVRAVDGASDVADWLVEELPR